MTKLRLIPPIRFSSVPDIDRTAMNWAQLLIDQLQKWSNSIDGTNITTGSIPLSDLTSSAWTSYVPGWNGSITNPAIGNGSITGRYTKFGNLVVATLSLTVGSTTTFGSGVYTFSLPFATVTAANLGNLQFLDSSTGSVYAGFTLTNSNIFFPVTTASPVANYSPTVPVTWATGDTFIAQVVFEAA